MVSLYRFNLVSLKDIYNDLKQYGYFFGTKTYQLNKHDIIVLLKNTKLFDEEEENYLLFYHPNKRKWNKLIPERKYYDRGERIYKVSIENKKVLVNLLFYIPVCIMSCIETHKTYL